MIKIYWKSPENDWISVYKHNDLLKALHEFRSANKEFTACIYKILIFDK
jgi:hypothetical protein